MFFIILKMVNPEKIAGCSDIKTNLETMKISQFKHEIPRANLLISEWMNDISISGETYSEIVRHKLNLYSTSS